MPFFSDFNYKTQYIVTSVISNTTSSGIKYTLYFPQENMNKTTHIYLRVDGGAWVYQNIIILII